MHTYQEIAAIFDEKGTFSINKVQVYKNGKKVENRFKFNEVVSINHHSKNYLETIATVFPQIVNKTKSGFKLTYAGNKAVFLIKKILPFLKNENRIARAKILLELSQEKASDKTHSPFQKMLKREELKSKLQLLAERP